MNTEQTFTLRQFTNIKDSRDRILKKYEHQKEKFTKLQNEHNILLSQVNYKEQSKLIESEQKNKKLREEIRTLKFQLEKKDEQREFQSEIYKELLEENKKLKEQNEQLKGRVSKVLETHKKTIQDKVQLIQELKDENKKLKEQKDKYLNLYKEKTGELIRLVPRTKRGLDPRNSRGW